MEIIFWIGVLLLILAAQVRVRDAIRGLTVKGRIQYFVILIFAIINMHGGLNVSLNNWRRDTLAEASSSLVNEPIKNATFVVQVANVYQHIWLNFICLSILVLLVIESYAWIRYWGRERAPPHSNRDWWTNVLIIMGLPALAFILNGFLSPYREPLDVIIQQPLAPLIALYNAPSILHYYIVGGGVQSELFSEFQYTSLDNFSRATLPWFIFCVALTYFLRRFTAKDKNANLIVGNAGFWQLFLPKHWRQLPWRGNYIQIYLMLLIGLPIISLSINVAPYYLIILIYNFFWLVPLILVIGVIQIFQKKK